MTLPVWLLSRFGALQISFCPRGAKCSPKCPATSLSPARSVGRAWPRLPLMDFTGKFMCFPCCRSLEQNEAVFIFFNLFYCIFLSRQIHEGRLRKGRAWIGDHCRYFLTACLNVWVPRSERMGRALISVFAQQNDGAKLEPEWNFSCLFIPQSHTELTSNIHDL